MSIFKKFIPEPSKADTESFKMRLKYGDDPRLLYKKAIEHRAIHAELTQQTTEILLKYYNVQESNEMYNWSRLDIHQFRVCDHTPVGHCVSMFEYGQNNPERGEPALCFGCGKQI